MKKIDLPLILDVIFYTVCAWFFAVGILRFYRVSFGISLLTASLIAISVGAASFLIIYYKHRRRILTKKERDRKEKLMLHFTLERTDTVLETFKNAFCAEEKEVFIVDNALEINGDKFIPLFTMQPVSADAIAVLLRTYGEEKFTVLCNALTPEAERLLASFGENAVRGEEVYALFERTHTMPVKLICGDIPRPKLRAKLRRSFSKKNARPFFTGGILLFAMSLFTFFPLYYIISGSVLLLSAICIRVLGYS